MVVELHQPVANLHNFRMHISHMLEDDVPLIGVDTETTGIDGIIHGADYLVGISVAYDVPVLGRMSAYFPFRHRGTEDNLPMECLEDLVQVLETKPLVFHNRKFDLHSLRTINISLDKTLNIQYDTMIEAHMWNEEFFSKELDALSKTFLRREKFKRDLKVAVEAWGWGGIEPWVMSPYAKQDAELTLDLHYFLWSKLEREDLTELWPYEQQYTNILYRMEQEGIKIDKEFLQEKIRVGSDICGKIESILSFNPRSSKQLGKFFVEDLGLPVVKYTKNGNPSFDKEALVIYDELLQEQAEGSSDPLVKHVAEYRGWATFLSLFAEPALGYCSPKGFIHTNYKQHGTKTGRLSSAKPNLQQIPRQSDKVWNGDAKHAFLPEDDDYELIGYDYSQLEFRLAIAYGGDQFYLDQFNNPDSDVFTSMAERLSLQRQTCKHTTYCMLYGGGLDKAASTIAKFEGIPLDEVGYNLAKGHYETFKASMPGVYGASNRASKLAEERGFVRLWTGRRRHLRDGYHRAFNSVLQGGGAELVKRAQIKLKEIESWDCRMVLQVHDEIVFKMRKECREEYEPRIIELMTDWPEFDVKFKVEGKVWNK